MQTELPKGLSLLQHGTAGTLSRTAGRYATRMFPNCFVWDVRVYGDSSVLTDKAADREVYAVVEMNSRDAKNVTVGRATVRLTQAALNQPFEVADGACVSFRRPMLLEDARRAAQGFYDSTAMTGRPVDPAFREELAKFILGRYGVAEGEVAEDTPAAKPAVKTAKKTKAKTKAPAEES